MKNTDGNNSLTLKEFKQLSHDWPLSDSFRGSMRRAIVSGEGSITLTRLSGTDKRWCDINGFSIEITTQHTINI